MELRLLGPVELVVAGQAVQLRRRQERCLLAILGLDAGRFVAVDRLMDMLWDGQPPGGARASVQAMVSHLRSALRAEQPGGARLVSRGTGYALEIDAEAVDVHRFRTLVAQARSARTQKERVELLAGALRLWRGPAMADAVPAGGDRARWCGDLDELHLAAREEWLRARLECGEHEQLVEPLTRLVEEHPLREHPRGLLMLALYRCGRRADALDAYQQARRTLAVELGLEPGPQLQRLQTAILTDEPGLSTAGWPSLAPAQLPADVAAFAGRERALAELDRVLAGGAASRTVVVTAIGGTAGVGKTALAVHWAHCVSGGFPDGQLYLNLRGFDPAGAALPVDTALRSLLDAMSVPQDRIPAELSAQVGLYRSVLANKRVLILLDNARDTEQVRPLLPAAPGCLVVVTSRNRLTGLVANDGAHPLTLDVLSTVEARQLLARRLGRDRVDAEPVAIEDIVTACAGLPLALSVAAARAVANPDFPLDSIAAELKSSRESLDGFSDSDPYADIRSVFSWSYHTLSQPAARLFRLLGLHPGPDIGVAAVASLAGLDPHPARAALTELVRAHLIAEYAPGRYVFHDLLRAYAGELVSEHHDDSDRRAALIRLLDHYLHTGHRGAQVLDPARLALAIPAPAAGVTVTRLDDPPAALAWFAAEHRALLAATAHAGRHGFESHAWRLARTLTTPLGRLGYWHDLVDAAHGALDGALRSADRTGQAHAHYAMANAHSRLGRFAEAEVHLRHAQELFHALDDRAFEALSHFNLCFLQIEQGRADSALQHAQRALDLYEAVGERYGQARALAIVGWANANLGNHDLAIDQCWRGLRLLQELGDRFGEANSWDSLGFAYHNLGRYRDAVDCYRRAVQLFQELGDESIEALVTDALGDSHHAAGDLDEARQAWQRAVTVLDSLGHARTDTVRAKITALDEREGSA